MSSSRKLMFELTYEGEDAEEPLEVHRYYEDGIAEILESDDSESSVFVWRLKDGRVQYWQDGFQAWIEDNAEVQQEYQAWISRQITE